MESDILKIKMYVDANGNPIDIDAVYKDVKMMSMIFTLLKLIENILQNQMD